MERTKERPSGDSTHNKKSEHGNPDSDEETLHENIDTGRNVDNFKQVYEKLQWVRHYLDTTIKTHAKKAKQKQ